MIIRSKWIIEGILKIIYIKLYNYLVRYHFVKSKVDVTSISIITFVIKEWESSDATKYFVHFFIQI